MRFRVRVHPGSRETRVERLADGVLRVKVSSPPIDGKANAEVVEALAAFLGVRKSRVRIVSGQSGRNKFVEISS